MNHFIVRIQSNRHFVSIERFGVTVHVHISTRQRRVGICPIGDGGNRTLICSDGIFKFLKSGVCQSQSVVTSRNIRIASSPLAFGNWIHFHQHNYSTILVNCFRVSLNLEVDLRELQSSLNPGAINRQFCFVSTNLCCDVTSSYCLTERDWDPTEGKATRDECHQRCCVMRKFPDHLLPSQWCDGTPPKNVV